jgi:ribosome-binding factor A
MQYRSDRLAHELKNELSFILAREVKDPRVGFATITQVRVSSDLRHARVFVSVLGSPTQQKETFAALHRAGGFIRRQLSGRLKLRHCPDLQFTFDDSLERGARMDKLIAEVSQELPVAPPADDSEVSPETSPNAAPEAAPEMTDANTPTFSEERSVI